MASGLHAYAAIWLKGVDVDWSDAFLAEITVTDEIGNSYSTLVPDSVSQAVARYLRGEGAPE